MSTFAVTVTLAVNACGTGEDARPPGDAASGDGGCEQRYVAVTLPGVPVDASRGCVETDPSHMQLIGLCASEEEHLSFSYYCFRRLSDGKEFWLNQVSKLAPDPKGWELCDPNVAPEDLRAPPPCFAAHCPTVDELGRRSVVESTCTPEATKEKFFCGARHSDWDDGCCRRQSCKDAIDCESGQECLTINPPAAWMYCWVSYVQGQEFNPQFCDCAAAWGAPPQSFCF